MVYSILYLFYNDLIHELMKSSSCAWKYTGKLNYGDSFTRLGNFSHTNNFDFN